MPSPVAPWPFWRTKSAPDERARLLAAPKPSSPRKLTSKPVTPALPVNDDHRLRAALHDALAPTAHRLNAAFLAPHAAGHVTAPATYTAPPRLPAPDQAPDPSSLIAELQARPPHAQLDALLAALTLAGAARLHAWALRPDLRERPGLLLALFAIGAATLGAANFVHEHGERLREASVDRPGQLIVARVGQKLGPTLQLGAGLGLEALSLSTGVWIACATGLVAAVTATAAAPLCALPIAALPQSARMTLSRVLRAYLFVEQPRGHVFEGLRHDLSAVMDHLHEGHVQPPPARHLASFAQWIEAHPVFSRRVGLPEPHPERIAVVQRGIVALHWPAWPHGPTPAPTSEPNAPHHHRLFRH